MVLLITSETQKVSRCLTLSHKCYVFHLSSSHHTYFSTSVIRESMKWWSMATDSSECACDDAFRKTTKLGGVTLHVDGIILWAEVQDWVRNCKWTKPQHSSLSLLWTMTTMWPAASHSCHGSFITVIKYTLNCFKKNRYFLFYAASYWVFCQSNNKSSQYRWVQCNLVFWGSRQTHSFICYYSVIVLALFPFDTVRNWLQVSCLLQIPKPTIQMFKSLV